MGSMILREKYPFYKKKGKICQALFGLENSLSFQAKIDDFDLKYCILKENAKNNISGSNAFLLVFTHGVKGTSSNDT